MSDDNLRACHLCGNIRRESDMGVVSGPYRFYLCHPHDATDTTCYMRWSMTPGSWDERLDKLIGTKGDR